MALTLSQMITRVRNNTNRTDTTENTDAEITAYLNEGQDDLGRRHSWNDLHTDTTVTLTASDSTYTWPTGFKECLGMRIMDGAESRWLLERSKWWLNQYEPQPTSRATARPLIFVRDGAGYELYPIPDSAYSLKINYTTWPTAMSATTDNADITRVDDVLIAYATAGLFRELGQYDNAAYWDNRFEVGYQRARIQDMKEPTWMPTADGVVTPHKVGPPTEYWNDPFYPQGY